RQPGAPAWGSDRPGWDTGQQAWGPPTQVGAPWAPGQQVWGGPGWGPPAPPPPRRGRLVTLIAVGVFLLAALGVGGYFLIDLTSSGGATVPADFRRITTSTLTYAVPPDWSDSPDAGSVLGAPLEGRADAPGYLCGENQYFRGIIASSFVPGERPADAVATAFARETGSSYYRSSDGGTPDVQVSAPRPFEAGGVPGQLVEATSRTPTDDGCLATAGTVLLLALPTTGPDGSPGTAVLIVNGDTAGGPADAPPLADRATLDAVLASARLPTI
ncbi:hypothetical protein I4J48_30655, partial [Pseudonocardia sp. KRD-169]|nr:hypothetical protein [Pseudonocardia abyssalis]